MAYTALKCSFESLAAAGAINPATPELYLLPADVARVFEVANLAAFSALPPWQRAALRKKARLVPRHHHAAA